MSLPLPVAPAAVTDQLVALLQDFIQDWDAEPESGIERQTRLLADLGFESIDVIQLVVAIEQEFGRGKLQFEKLLMVNGRYVDDLSVGQIADFVASRL